MIFIFVIEKISRFLQIGLIITTIEIFNSKFRFKKENKIIYCDQIFLNFFFLNYTLNLNSYVF